jgi:hypothetical protein
MHTAPQQPRQISGKTTQSDAPGDPPAPVALPGRCLLPVRTCASVGTTQRPNQHKRGRGGGTGATAGEQTVAGRASGSASRRFNALLTACRHSPAPHRRMGSVSVVFIITWVGVGGGGCGERGRVQGKNGAGENWQRHSVARASPSEPTLTPEPAAVGAPALRHRIQHATLALHHPAWW